MAARRMRLRWTGAARSRSLRIDEKGTGQTSLQKAPG
jgi:hypothetical protein